MKDNNIELTNIEVWVIICSYICKVIIKDEDMRKSDAEDNYKQTNKNQTIHTSLVLASEVLTLLASLYIPK